MSFIADAGLTAIPVVGDFLAGASNASAVKDAYKHRYQWEVADLKKAGLNPALAYGHQPSTPQVGTMPDVGSSAARGYQAMQQGKQSSAAARLTSAQAALLEAQTSDLQLNLQLKNALLRGQGALTGAQTEATQAGTKLTNARTVTEGYTQRDIDQRITESRERIKLLEAQVGLTRVEAMKANAVIQQIRQDVAWRQATWDVQLKTLHQALAQAGVNIQLARLEKVARDLGLNEKRAESEFYDEMGGAGAGGAQQLLRTILQFIKQ